MRKKRKRKHKFSGANLLVRKYFANAKTEDEVFG